MAFKKSENFTQDTNNPRLMTDRNELDAKKIIYLKEVKMSVLMKLDLLKNKP